MNPKQLLNDFHEYIRYDSDQKQFNLLSFDFAFHDAGKKIEDLLSGYDPTGVLAVMYAREIFLKAAQEARFCLFDFLTKQAVKDDIKRDQEMYQKFHDPEIIALEKAYMDQMNSLVVQASGKSMIGNRDMAAERKSFSDAVLKAVDDLKKCRIDVYKKAGPIGKIEKFTTKILVFERMADCLLHMEKAPDALYFCYINQYGSADGYFSFLVKNNGNIVSICDRVKEEYIGQHNNMRNARWTEAHADGIFPYDFIFRYAEHDYKGYATKYMIDDEKLEFMNLQPEVYQPILVAMILLRNKYEGWEFKEEPLYLSTMMKEYYLEEHPGTELMVLKDSSIAERHEGYSPELPLSEIMDGTLNRKFQMSDVGNLWVKLYGDGFQPDYHSILSVSKPERMLKDKTKPEFYSEFVGSKEQMDREVYRKIRIQLAEYIKRKMEEEYDRFGGGREAVRHWIHCVQSKKKTLLDAFCLFQYYSDHPDKKPERKPRQNKTFSDIYMVEPSDSVYRITKREKEQPSGYSVNQVKLRKDGSSYLEEPLDDRTGKSCSIFFKISFHNWIEMESLIEKPLPKIFTGWTDRGELGYNGNSILSVTDAVGDIQSPLYGGRRPSNNEQYHGYGFDVWMGFSKLGWKKVYEDWLIENGLAAEIERMKEERKEEKRKKIEEECAKRNLPAKPYEPSESLNQYDNGEELIRIEKELDSILPGCRFGVFGLSGNNCVSVSISVKEKGNKEKIEKLKALGWYSLRRRYKGANNSFYVKLSREVPYERKKEQAKS